MSVARAVDQADVVPENALQELEGVQLSTIGNDHTRATVVEAQNVNDAAAWLGENEVAVQNMLNQHGAVLLRHFPIRGIEDFEHCAEELCPDLFTEYGDLPRASAASKVYESTPYPADSSILFHNEASHTVQWPLLQWFYCIIPAQQRGATPFVDGRSIYQALDPSLRATLEAKGLRYVRNFVEGLDVDWRDFFKTDDKSMLEQQLDAQGIDWAWNGDTLRTSRQAQAITTHPVTGQDIFFNQIFLHHVSCLPAKLRDALLALYDEEELPRNVSFGDGTPIPDDVVLHLLELYEQHAARFIWQANDVLLVDNMLIAHGRDPFVGPRKIAVAMGSMQSA